MADSLADLDRIVERCVLRMDGLLMFGKELKVFVVHISAMVPQDLVNTFKVRLIPLSSMDYIGLNFVPFYLAALGLAPFKDLSKHTVNILRSWVVREDVGIKGAHVHPSGEGHVAILLGNTTTC